MKVEFQETKWETYLMIKPETPDELAQLFRMVKNSKAQKPDMYLSFGSESGREIYASVSMRKLSEKSNQVVTSINNNK